MTSIASKSLDLLRVPVRWERLQPALFGPLDAVNLAALKRNIDWARSHGGGVIIDVHNFGRFKVNENGALRIYVLDNVHDGVVKVPRSALADLWVKLSDEFQSEPAVYAYGLMNEPHDMGAADWKAISQDALTAIRNNGDDKLVMVAGDRWSSAAHWPEIHGPASWIEDPAGNFAYEAHVYFDHDLSGVYNRSYQDELAADPNLSSIGPRRLQPFVDWCRANNVRGFIGEYGVPNTDPRWNEALDNFLAAVDAAGFDGTYWAGGQWWGDYELSLEPLDDFTRDRPQMKVLQGRLGLRLLTSVSAAGAAGAALSPASLATGYGAGLSSAAVSAAALPLPVLLGGVEVLLTDRNGRTVSASLIFVSPNQINYLTPGDLALGAVQVTVRKDGVAAAKGILYLERVAPSLFAANGGGRGVAAAQILRVGADGSRTIEPAARFDPEADRFVSAPIVFGEEGERLFLAVFGTGFRGVSDLSAAKLSLGETDLALLYAGPQPEFPGLDQANAELPRELAGSGELPLRFSVDSKFANELILAFE